MRPSHILLCLAPTIALAVDADQVPAAVAPSPSVPNTTPPVPLPAVVDEDSYLALDTHQMLRINQPVDIAAETPSPEQWAGALRGSIGLGSLKSDPGMTKSLRARSEGTLGQTPWIGMAIGLTCTALAAVMLG